MATLSFTTRTPIRFAKTMHDTTIEVVPVGIEYEFVVRDLAGHTISTVRLDADEALNLMGEMDEIGVTNVKAEMAYSEGFNDGAAAVLETRKAA